MITAHCPCCGFEGECPVVNEDRARWLATAECPDCHEQFPVETMG